ATPLLSQNYPNPFNPETTISFQMPKAAPVRLAIYNVKGQLVKVLHDGTASQGDNSVVWDGTDAGGNAVSSGIYFSRLESGSKTEIRKMMLMK
ncbi:MAG: T9SS type A sorting domain-containing protein, partial [Candidatus Cloacimonetes bacterium]|nr:T9SS type A sorting domain-containing protein [Candidatus Cloacimonadota bacterium]